MAHFILLYILLFVTLFNIIYFTSSKYDVERTEAIIQQWRQLGGHAELDTEGGYKGHYYLSLLPFSDYYTHIHYVPDKNVYINKIRGDHSEAKMFSNLLTPPQVALLLYNDFITSHEEIGAPLHLYLDPEGSQTFKNYMNLHYRRASTGV